MKCTWGIQAFGLVEIGIGSVTFVALMVNFLLGTTTKPPAVFIFVLTTSLASLTLGIGIIRRSPVCYRLLLYFSTVIILSKILILSNIITLSGALETTVPPIIKNVVSILYHSVLILCFIQPSIRKEMR